MTVATGRAVGEWYFEHDNFDCDRCKALKGVENPLNLYLGVLHNGEDAHKYECTVCGYENIVSLELLQQIEEQRALMIDLGQVRGYTHPDTIRASKELDKLMNMVMKGQ